MVASSPCLDPRFQTCRKFHISKGCTDSLQRDRYAPAARQTSMASWAAWARLASSARQDSRMLLSCSFKAPQAAKVCEAR